MENLEKATSALVFIFLLLIPSYQGTQLANYDLVVGNGNKLMLFNFTSLDATLNLPVTEFSRDVKISSVVPDLQINAIYFSLLTKNSSSINVFYPERNQTIKIYSGAKGSIGSLSLHEENLYWCNESNNTVMKLSVANWTEMMNYSQPKPELVFQDVNGTFESLVIYPKNGVILYTMWIRSNESKILAYDLKSKSIKTAVDNLHQPKGLFIDANSESLYWIDNPPGIYFTIEKINLSNYSGRDLIVKDQNQHPFAIIVQCSKLFWTDLMNKALWEFQPFNKSYNLLKYFNVVPYGMSLTKRPSVEECKEKDAQELQSTTLTITQAPPSKGCFGSKCSKALVEQLKYVSLDSPMFCSPSQEQNCHNGATCVTIKDHVHCICTPEFGGPRCGWKLDDTKYDAMPSFSSISSTTPFIISCSVFSAVILVLLIIVSILGWKVRKQNVQPKIRRRVVVSHRSDADNGSVCEMIDIENCCNMNICETPCYERLGTAASSSSGRVRRNSTKDDKKCLLNS